VIQTNILTKKPPYYLHIKKVICIYFQTFWNWLHW